MRNSIFAAITVLGATLMGAAHAQGEKYHIRPEIQELLRFEPKARGHVCQLVLARHAARQLKLAADKELFTDEARKDFLVEATTSLYRSLLFGQASGVLSGKSAAYVKAYTERAMKSEDSAGLHQLFCNATMAQAEKNGNVSREKREKAIQEAVELLKSAVQSEAAPDVSEGSAPRPGARLL